MTTTLIEVKQARCRIGRRRLLTVEQLSIRQGENWCVFGPNGAGKTLLAELLAGQRNESGSYARYAPDFDPTAHCLWVSFEAQQHLWQRDNRLDISDYREDAQDVGTRVEDLISNVRSQCQQEQATLTDLIKSLDLEAIAHKGIRFLSSGQMRRALLARALYGGLAEENRLVILDDPLESIDRGSRQQIQDCIASARERGMTSLELCRRARDLPIGCSHLAVMKNLGLLAAGPFDRISKGETFQNLIESRPQIPARLPISTPGSQSPEPETKLIELHAVRASFGPQQVLKDVDWTMLSSEHVLIEGPNGCGKSTLLSLIDGENHKGYGQDVSLFGKRKGSGESVWEIKAQFGVVSNELHNKYIKGWRVLDVVVSGFFDSVGLYDDSGSAEQHTALAWLDAIGLQDARREYYHELSFGQQRLVLLARAMVKEPRILILDEPCVGLDDYYRQLVLGILDRIADLSPTRLIYVTHDPGEYPSSMTTSLQFVDDGGGGYRLISQPIQPRM